MKTPEQQCEENWLELLERINKVIPDFVKQNALQLEGFKYIHDFGFAHGCAFAAQAWQDSLEKNK